MTLGPYALCLSYILASAKLSVEGKIDYVYRGMVMTSEQFNEQFVFGKDVENINESSQSLVIKQNNIKIIQRGF